MKLPSSDGAAVAKPSVLDRLLSFITVVEPGEAASALLLALDICVLLCAYYVLKPVREALILASSGGAELKSYAAVGQVLLLSALVPGYSWLVNRFDRGRLIRTVTFIFIGCLVAFYFAAKAELPGLGLAFFLWVGVFNLMVVAQFWAFASDLYSRKQGERLFPIVAFGASMGAVAGSQLTSLLVAPLGVAQMMLVSGGLLLGALLLSSAAERATARIPKPQPKDGAVAKSGDSESGDAKSAGSGGAFQLVFRSRYLLLIGTLMLLLNLVNTTGEFLLGSLVKEHVAKLAHGAAVKVQIGEFYSKFFFWVNCIGAAVQLFITPRLIRHFGVRVALLVMPLFSLMGYGAASLLPLLAVVRWGKTSENALDYSLNNTVRNALFLPLSSEEKYKAKQVVDTLFVRAGDVLSAGLVFLGLRFLHLPLRIFAMVNFVVVVLWLCVAWALGRAYVKRSDESVDSAKASRPGS